MLLTRKLNAQNQQYNKIITKIFLEKIPLLPPKCEEPKRYKRGIIRIIFKAIVDIASQAVSAFIRQRRSKALYKALLAIGRQQYF